MMNSDETKVAWTDRPGFIHDAAVILYNGGDWESVMKILPKYARPYRVSYPDSYPIREDRGRLVPLRLGVKQSKDIQISIQQTVRTFRTTRRSKQ